MSNRFRVAQPIIDTFPALLDQRIRSPRSPFLGKDGPDPDLAGGPKSASQLLEPTRDVWIGSVGEIVSAQENHTVCDAFDGQNISLKRLKSIVHALPRNRRAD